MKRENIVVNLVVMLLTAMGFTVEVRSFETTLGTVIATIRGNIPTAGGYRYITIEIVGDRIDYAYGKYGVAVLNTESIAWWDIVDFSAIEGEITVKDLYDAADAIAHA